MAARRKPVKVIDVPKDELDELIELFVRKATLAGVLESEAAALRYARIAELFQELKTRRQKDAGS